VQETGTLKSSARLRGSRSLVSAAWCVQFPGVTRLEEAEENLKSTKDNPSQH